MKQAILCVDDEAIILMALKQELRSEFGDRFHYESAMDASQALDAIEALVAEGIQVILVISDWLMPGIRGDEFLEIVRERYPTISAIMITGQADERAIERVKKNACVVSVLGKPWDAKELKKKVQECCLS